MKTEEALFTEIALGHLACPGYERFVGSPNRQDSRICPGSHQTYREYQECITERVQKILEELAAKGSKPIETQKDWERNGETRWASHVAKSLTPHAAFIIDKYKLKLCENQHELKQVIQDNVAELLCDLAKRSGWITLDPAVIRAIIKGA